MNSLKILILGASTALLLSDAAHAEKYAIATFIEPTHPITRYQHTEFADRVRELSKGEIDFEVFTGGSLMPPGGTLQGVADGVAQVSIFPPSYSPSALPVLNSINDLGWLNPDPMLLSFAYADFNFNEKIAQDDWKKNGVLYGAGHATPIYRYMCKGDVQTFDDLKGKKTRMPGSAYARLGDTLGLTSVNLPASEIYTGLERGAIDCVCGDLTHLLSGSTIGDLVNSIVMVELSPYFSSAGLMYDRDFWKSLRDDQRRLLLDEGARSMVRLNMAYAREENEALEWAKAKGIAVVEPDPALQKAYADWVANGVGDMVSVAREKFGVQDPEAVFELFETYIAKWEKLLEGVDRNSEDALLAVLKTNLFDKIDVVTYGME